MWIQTNKNFNNKKNHTSTQFRAGHDGWKEGNIQDDRHRKFTDASESCFRDLSSTTDEASDWEKNLIQRFQIQRKRWRERLRVIHLFLIQERLENAKTKTFF